MLVVACDVHPPCCAPGDVVPADCRLISATDCKVDESMLTGESMDVSKTATWVPEGDKKTLSPGNCVFSGHNRAHATEQHSVRSHSTPRSDRASRSVEAMTAA